MATTEWVFRQGSMETGGSWYELHIDGTTVAKVQRYAWGSHGWDLHVIGVDTTFRGRTYTTEAEAKAIAIADTTAQAA